MRTVPTPPPPEPLTTEKTKLVPVRPVAEMLSVSRAKVYQMMDAGELPYVKFGKSRRLKLADIEKFIEQSTICRG